MKVALLLLAAATAFADCGYIEGIGNICCPDGKHPEASSTFVVDWVNGIMVVTQLSDCVDNPQPPQGQ